MTLQQRILQRRKQFLVHSYLYYKHDVSIVSDADFDRWAAELLRLQTDHPEIASIVKYHDECSGLDSQLSGYYVTHYPYEIMSDAVKLVAYHERTTTDKVAKRFRLSLR